MFFVLVSSAALGQEVHPFFEGARAWAMGGAQIAVVNDETALIANPAALGKLRETYVTILDPELDMGQNALSMYSGGNITNPLDPSQVINGVNSNKAQYYHARAQVFPSIVGHNFGFGIFGRQELDMQENSAGTSVNTYYTQDVAALLGFNLRFFDGRIKLGVVGKAIDRIQINNTAIPVSGTTWTPAALASEGAGVGTDVGLILTAPWKYLPTLSAVARDVGDTQFTAGKNLLLTTSTIPTRINHDYDVAVALFPIHTNRSRSSITFEEQQVLAAQTSLDPTRYYHFGYEFNLADVLFIRAGMNGRYYTAGFEISSEHFQIMGTTYGVDVGTAGTSNVEDRRYVGKVAFRF
jgi:hypothetical protein